MIGIFNNKTTKEDLIKYNGEYILDNICSSYKITEELNGEFSFDGTFIINPAYPKETYDLMTNDSLIKADDEFGIEYFRIAKVIKNKKKFEIFARQITISETLTMFCEDVRPTKLNGNSAINWLIDHARGLNWLNVSSDIPGVNTAYYMKKTLYEALFSTQNSFIETWGGEVYRRGFNLSVNQKVGMDRGVSIRSGKNLQGIEESSNLNTLITSIYPVGFDGITIEEKFINSPYVNNYSKIYPATIKFEDIKVKGENVEEGYDTLEEAQTELKRRTNLMFTKDKVDILTSDYTITFAEIGKAEGYKDYALLETTWLGDIVNVYEETLGLDIKVRVTKRVYDGIKKKRISTSLSNKNLNYKPPTIAQIVKELESIDSTDTVLSLAKEQASALIKGGLKDSFVIVRPGEILIMNTKDINTATSVWRMNNAGIGYSGTGYFGTYGLAMTMDGQIVADFITTGILNAELIKSGVLRSFNSKTWINMEDGTFDFGGKITFDGNNLNINLAGQTIPGLKEVNDSAQDAINIASSKVSFTDLTGLGKTEINGSNVTTGTLRSANGKSLINLENGTFNFGNKLTFDGTDIKLEGSVKNGVDGYSTELNRGGVIFTTTNEEVGGIRASLYEADRKINGISIVATPNGDFIDLGYTDSVNIGASSKFTPQIRLTKNKIPLTGNFVGIQLLDDIRVNKSRILYIESVDENNPHEIFGTTLGNLSFFGDNGVNIGYKVGTERVSTVQIDESPNGEGSQIFIYKQLSMANKKIINASEIYSGATTGRYYNDAFCGSIEATAKRISNLNVFLDSGWYGFAEGTNGSPTTWGVVLHLKLSSADFSQLVLGTNNKMYTRWWVSNNWTSWVER